MCLHFAKVHVDATVNSFLSEVVLQEKDKGVNPFSSDVEGQSKVSFWYPRFGKIFQC